MHAVPVFSSRAPFIVHLIRVMKWPPTGTIGDKPFMRRKTTVKITQELANISKFKLFMHLLTHQSIPLLHILLAAPHRHPSDLLPNATFTPSIQPNNGLSNYPTLLFILDLHVLRPFQRSLMVWHHSTTQTTLLVNSLYIPALLCTFSLPKIGNVTLLHPRPLHLLQPTHLWILSLPLPHRSLTNRQLLRLNITRLQ